MRLQKIDTHNLWEVVQLSVNEEQKGFVATNTQSILEAYATISEGHVDKLNTVGFLMNQKI